MKKYPPMYHVTCWPLITALLAGCASTPGSFSGPMSVGGSSAHASPNSAQGEAKKEGDATGTNPVLFTNDFRIYTEMQELNVPGNNSSTVNTLSLIHI